MQNHNSYMEVMTSWKYTESVCHLMHKEGKSQINFRYKHLWTYTGWDPCGIKIFYKKDIFLLTRLVDRPHWFRFCPLKRYPPDEQYDMRGYVFNIYDPGHIIVGKLMPSSLQIMQYALCSSCKLLQDSVIFPPSINMCISVLNRIFKAHDFCESSASPTEKSILFPVVCYTC